MMLAAISLATISLWVGLVRPALVRAAESGSDFAAKIVGY